MLLFCNKFWCSIGAANFQILGAEKSQTNPLTVHCEDPLSHLCLPTCMADMYTEVSSTHRPGWETFFTPCVPVITTRVSCDAYNIFPRISIIR